MSPSLEVAAALQRALRLVGQTGQEVVALMRSTSSIDLT
jgi:hypothetical protein